MLENIKTWSDQASVRIRVYNTELETLQREVLMTVQQMIDRVITDKDKTIAKLEQTVADRDQLIAKLSAAYRLEKKANKDTLILLGNSKLNLKTKESKIKSCQQKNKTKSPKKRIATLANSKPMLKPPKKLR